MFMFYLNTLHNHHEKALVLGKKTSDAYLAILESLVDGQFKMAMSMLHPIMSGPSASQPIAHWEYQTNAENQHQLVMHWLNQNKEKLDELNRGVLAIIEHNTSGWSTVSNELLTKIQTDVAPELQTLLSLGKTTVEQLAEVESVSIKEVERATTLAPQKVAVKRRRSPATKPETGK